MNTEVELPKPKPGQSKEDFDLTMKDHFRRYAVLRGFAIVAMALFALYLFAALFGPTPEYRLASPPSAINGPDFVRQLESLIDSRVEPNTSVEFLPNGDRFYEAELAAIRAAKQSVNIEAYLWKKGEVTRRFVDALAERARAGVKVRVVVDGIGNWTLRKSYFKQLTDAGGQIEWYHPTRWHTLFRSNNRTHREIVVVDGTTAFIGGAGFGDHWFKAEDEDNPRWRDNMFLVRGEAVRAIQAAFIENWLEASGEVLNGAEFFPPLQPAGSATSMVVASSPTHGGSTHARVLYQILLGSAKGSIDITTPYFVPDEYLIDVLKNAASRGVRVRVTLPGDKIDHALVRYTSRRTFGDLLAAGVEIYEYQPAMIHAKVLVVDGIWSVLGTTNLDHRSFGLNDEINMAVLDPQLAATLRVQYEQDLAQSKRVTLDEWKKRGVWERAVSLFGRAVERQQ